MVICDCSALDIYACFIARHQITTNTSNEQVAAAGGPCLCTCHPRTSWNPLQDATLWGDALPAAQPFAPVAHPVDPVKMLGRVGKTNPMIAVYGAGPAGTKCGDCAHFVSHRPGQNNYYKCRERGVTSGPGTDHRVHFATCAKYMTAQWVIDDATAKATRKSAKKAEKKTMTAPTKKATMSHTKYETWQHCQEQARQVYEDHIAGGPSVATTLGSAFHSALEAYTNVLIDTTTPLGETALLRIAVDALDDEIIKADPTREFFIPHYDNMVTRLQTMIRAFCEHIAPKYAPTQRPEQPIRFALADDLDLIGVIDAETGRAIIDWKTAKSQKTWQGQPWIADQSHTAQAATYLMARPDAAKLTFIVFACTADAPEKCEVVSYVVKRESVDVAGHQRALIRAYQEMQEARATGIYYARPGPLCGGKGYACPALATCKIGQLYLQHAGRECDAPALLQIRKQQILRCPNPVCNTTIPASISMTFRACGRGVSGVMSSCECPSCETSWLLTRDSEGHHISAVTIHNSTPLDAAM